jgi:DNA-directed RNA polymerase specialized sigma24 family protein
VSPNDPLLGPLLAAESEAARDASLGQLAARAQEIVDDVLSRRGQSMTADEAKDVGSTVMLRLIERLQRAGKSEACAIGRFDDFVATLTYHVIYDLLRRRFPERARLKNRLRYVVTRDPRLASWPSPSGTLAGLSAWKGTALYRPLAITRGDASPAMLDANDPARAVTSIVQRAGGPVLFDDLVRLTALFWDVREVELVRTDIRTDVQADVTSEDLPLQRMESRQTLEQIWREVRALQPRQRAALLLNLRDTDGENAVPLLVTLGTATIDEVSAAIGLTTGELATIWNELPLSDLRIAAILGVTRQQVINFRKAARERLARRMRTEPDHG